MFLEIDICPIYSKEIHTKLQRTSFSQPQAYCPWRHGFWLQNISCIHDRSFPLPLLWSPPSTSPVRQTICCQTVMLASRMAHPCFDTCPFQSILQIATKEIIWKQASFPLGNLQQLPTAPPLGLQDYSSFLLKPLSSSLTMLQEPVSSVPSMDPAPPSLQVLCLLFPVPPILCSDSWLVWLLLIFQISFSEGLQLSYLNHPPK